MGHSASQRDDGRNCILPVCSVGCQGVSALQRGSGCRKRIRAQLQRPEERSEICSSYVQGCSEACQDAGTELQRCLSVYGRQAIEPELQRPETSSEDCRSDVLCHEAGTEDSGIELQRSQGDSKNGCALVQRQNSGVEDRYSQLSNFRPDTEATRFELQRQAAGCKDHCADVCGQEIYFHSDDVCVQGAAESRCEDSDR